MRSLTTALITGALLTAAPFALAQDAPAKKAAVAQANVSDFTDADMSEAAIEKGLAALAKSRMAYRNAAAISESIKIEVSSPMGKETLAMKSVYGKDAFTIEMEGQMQITGVGKDLYLTIPASTDKYMSKTVGADEPMEKALTEMTGGGGIPDPAVPFRLAGKKDIAPKDIPSLLSMGAVMNPKLAGFRTSATGEQVLLKGDDGTSIISINGKTGLIDRIDIKAKPPGAPAGFSMGLAFIIDAKTMKDLPKPIAFSTTGKTGVDKVEDLFPKPGTLATGQEAPAFDLDSLDGGKVSLASLRGNVVVLDFWATWCGPCRAGMPAMNELGKWAASSGLPIKVFAVNIGEPRQKAADYWKNEKFGFPCLLDPNNASAMAYGAQSIPLTVVIDPEGKVAEIEVGLSFNPNDEASKAKHLDAMKAKLASLAGGKG